MSDKTEIELLKERANKLNITYNAQIGVEKLKAKIEAKLNDTETGEDNDDVDAVEVPKKLTKGQRKAKLRREATALVRVKVACMNPNKREWEGEIISAGNSAANQEKKYVPFNLDEGYHLPKIIVNYLKEKECQIFVTTKDSRGNKSRKGKLIKEFAVEELPPLTKAEIADLAKKQAMGNNID